MEYDEQYLLDRADELLRENKHEDSLRVYNKALNINSKNAKTWNSKGICLIGLNNLEEAIKCFAEAIQLDHNRGDAWGNKGTVLSMIGQYNASIECFNEAIRMQSNSAYLWNSKGDALAKLDKYEEAINCFEEVLKIDPYYASAWFSKGIIMGMLNNHNEALIYLDRYTQLNPNDGDGWHNKGIALTKLDRYKEAIDCLTKSIEIDPSRVSSWISKGNTFHKLGNDVDAVECINEAIIKNQPNSLILPEWYVEISRNEPSDVKNEFVEDKQYKLGDRHQVTAHSYTNLQPVTQLKNSKVILYQYTINFKTRVLFSESHYIKLKDYCQLYEIYQLKLMPPHIEGEILIVLVNNTSNWIQASTSRELIYELLNYIKLNRAIVPGFCLHNCGYGRELRNVKTEIRTIDGTKGAFYSADMHVSGWSESLGPIYFILYIPRVNDYPHVTCIIKSTVPWKECTEDLFDTVHITKGKN
ncbi:MAG: tetratricopeptide repeat protein [Methanothrix sp.]|nr:tetratricopeptide repeat protein [Methanothrix sp.]